MKNHAKLTTLVITLMLVATLIGCAPKPTATAVPTSPPQPTAVPATAVPPPTNTPVPQPITLKYANWNLGTPEENNIQRQLITAYTETHPWVTIEFVDMTGDWEAVLTSMAAKGELPDVFAGSLVPLYVKNGWLADLTELTAADTDWANVPQALQNGFSFNGKVLGLPEAQFIMGFWVNQDLYEAANLDAPAYGISIDDFMAVAAQLNNPAKAVLGLDEQYHFLKWYANTQDSNLKEFSFDGTKFNYNSSAFKAAVAMAAEVKPLTWQGLSEEQIKNFKSVGPWELFGNGEAGVRWDASWNVPGWITNNTFKWDFVGIPGGTQELVYDAIVVSATTADVKEAYEFAKWMSFSPVAYAKEVELAKAANSAPKMPVSVDAASIELYKTFVDKPGILAALANLDNSLVESLQKSVPGYADARWNGKPGIDIGEDKDVTIGWMMDNSYSGKFKFEDYSAQLEEFANNILATAAAEMPK